MKAVILAAGTASRLRPLTSHRPKCLLEIAGRTLLERNIDALLAAGITDMVVVTGYLSHMIEDFLKEKYPQVNFTFIHNPMYDSTNNIYSLYISRPEVDGKDFLLLDSDILYDPALLPALLEKPYTCLAMNRHECGEEEIKVIADADKNVVELSKTCSIADALGESVGIEKINADYSTALYQELERMIEGPEKLSNVFYERAFERLIPQGYTFKYVDTTDFPSMELDTVEDFETAQHLWKL